MTVHQTSSVQQVESPAPMTLAEFMALTERVEAQDRHFELIDMSPTEKPMTRRAHGQIIFKLSFYLQSYFIQVADALPQAWAGAEVTSYLPQDERNVRQPDLSIFLHECIEDSAAAVMPDIAVEVKSRPNPYHALRDKAHFYLSPTARRRCG